MIQPTNQTGPYAPEDQPYPLPDMPVAAFGPTRVRYLVLAAGCALAVLTYIQRLGFFRAVPSIKRDLGLDDELVGYVAGAFLIAYGGFQVVGGFLGDRLGARTLLTALVLGWSALVGANALFALLPAGSWWVVWLLLGMCFLFGMLQSGGFPNWARVVADWMPVTERGLAQGTSWTFSRLGGAIAPMLFLWLCIRTPDGKGVATFGWVPFFLAAGGLGILWCAVFWLWFRNRPEEMGRVNAAERALIASGRTAALKPGAAPWSHMLQSRSVWGLCLLYGFGGFSGNFITSLLSVYLKDHRHLTEDETSWLAGLPLASGLVACFLGGFLSDWIIRRTGNRKWGRRITICVGFCGAGLAYLVVPWVHEVWLLALVFCAVFFGNDLMIGPAWASCADIGERHAGTLSGAMNMTGSVFGAVGMTMAGALLKRGQEELLFILFAGSYGLAALSSLAVDVTRPLAPKQVGGAESQKT